LITLITRWYCRGAGGGHISHAARILVSIPADGSSRESVICELVQESSVIFLKSPVFSAAIVCPRRVCLTRVGSVFALFPESHLPALLMPMMRTASHREICNHSLIESLTEGRANAESHAA